MRRNRGKRRISIIATGGTIGSSRSAAAGIRLPAEKFEFIESVIRDLGLENVCHVARPFSMFSENITLEDWPIIADFIQKEISKGADAILVTHGTDTMAYTASAMHYMLSPLPVPVVFTGSLVPPEIEGSDARINIELAIHYLLSTNIPILSFLFSDPHSNTATVYRSTQFRSVAPYDHSFSGFEKGMVARVSKAGIFTNANYSNSKEMDFEKKDDYSIRHHFSPKVGVVKVYPGLSSEYLHHYSEFGFSVIILDMYHSGTAYSRRNKNRSSRKDDYYDIREAIRYMTRRGVLVLGYGIPSSIEDQYSSTQLLIDAGLMPSPRLSIEALIVKSMWSIPHSTNPDSLYRRISKSYYGDIINE